MKEGTVRHSRTVAFVLLLLVAGASSHCGSSSNQAPSTFVVVVEFSNTGLEARCEKGCAWRELTYSCGSGGAPCQVRIDERGVAGVAR